MISHLRFNILIVSDGVIRTSTDKAVLKGVSRAMVFDLAKQLDIPLVQEDIQPYDIYTAEEVFFTTTSPCVLPVTKVDNRQIGDGLPGRITQQLLASWSESVGMDIVDQALNYAAAKAALSGFTKAWAREFAPYRIQVNAVAPGFVLTGMTRGSNTPEMVKERGEGMPLGRLTEPEDISYAVAWLASSETEMITGQVISPNSGEVIVGY